MQLFCTDCNQPVEFNGIDAAGCACPFCGKALTADTAAPPMPAEPSQAPSLPPVANAADAAGQIGRYRIKGRLGVGGLAEVYLGQDEELKRAVAVKVLHSHLLRSARTIELFLEEARTLASLDHPGIIPIYDAGRTPDGQCYLVMKLFRGSDLAQRMKQGRVPRDEAVEHMAQAAEALHYAHHRGLIHRDVKPQNLLLDASDRIVVADFGLALREENFGTGPAFVGTVPYMSPEQARHEGHRVDARTDVYSLGVVFYELLTGRRPFTGDTEEALLAAIIAGEPTRPRRVDDTIPSELDRIGLKVIARRASDRYQTAQEFAADLRLWQKEKQRGDSGSRIVFSASDSVQRDSGGPARVVPRGMRAFEPGDAGFFLDLVPGPRDRDGLPDSIAFWKIRIENPAPESTFSLGVLYGPAGCGKTSLVRAGLLPRLAESVAVVMIEASAGETEARLRRELYVRFPSLPPDLSLVAVFERLRRAGDAGRKVVVMLDQFEQWLHGRGDAASAELTQAIRQCDGGRLQCVLLVRDEFWLPLNRFLRAAEVRLEEGVNGALMDLFDPLHARKVLIAYGRAFGRVPEAGDVPEEVNTFLDEAVAGLTESGKVAPLRLNLFAEVVKSKPWQPKTLTDMGGAAGVGEAFLENAFGAGAPPGYKLRARAAEAVLHALLPPPGITLQRFTRTRDELLAASGYQDRPDSFANLMHVLDPELRLISPTAVGGSAAPPGVEMSSAYYNLHEGEGASYQLTHDFLVPVLRNWLARKQHESSRGRAALRLAQCAEWWAARPEDRQLPTPLEWAHIRLFTRRANWTEPQRRMMQRAGRYYTVRGLVGAGIFLLLAGVGVYWVRLEAEKRARDRAGELVAHVRTVHDSQWSRISEELKQHRKWAKPLLEQVLVDPDGDDDERMHARMALLALDPSQRVPLQEALLQADAGDHREIVRVLEPYREQVVPELWQVTKDPKASPAARFRAGAALATLDPDGAGWPRAAADVAAELVAHDSYFLRSWLPTLKPVREALTAPLTRLFADSEHPQRRERATEALADLAADQPARIADLLLQAEPAQFARLWPDVASHRERIATRMERELEEPAPPRDRDAWARRRARAAVALVRLGRGDSAWPLLRHRPDGPTRAFLIHAFAPCGADPDVLAARLDVEPDASARRALLLSLGEYPADAVPARTREPLVARVIERRAKETDAGLRAAGDWLLRRWKKDIAATDGKVATPGWSIDGQGHTMVLIAPEEFTMGSPASEAGRFRDEAQHRCRIPRSYALAAAPLSNEQFARFRKEHPVERGAHIDLYSSRVDSPAIGISWFVAARYCRWLSEQEGVPEEQMCYPPIAQIKPGMTMPADFLTRTGYRLPTEAEWEYACRAGAVTSRYYGDTDDLLDAYAWYSRNADDHAWPAGAKKPNDFGLFSMHGNVWNWCQDRYRPYPTGAMVVSDEEDAERVIAADQTRVLRGGAFTRRASLVRAAARYPNVPTYEYVNVGLRVARTVP